jgi:maltokinase
VSVKEDLTRYIETARWFGGKGRPFEVTASRRILLTAADQAAEDGPRVTIELAELTYADGAGADVYQVPASYYTEEQESLEHALIGQFEDDELGEVWCYDALHDHKATPVFLHGFAAGLDTDAVRFVTVGSPELDTEARSTLLSGEQSNSSVVFGETALMKVFRRVTPGVNPDIEVLSALTEAGNEHIACLYGWVETKARTGDVLQLAILQQFLRTASDGWEIALSSLRNLFADGTVAVEDAGGDFAAEAHRLGVAVADLHASMAQAFPTSTWSSEQLGGVADAMSARLEAALPVVPELGEHAPALHASFDAVRHLTRPVVSQRVHGDLHLGQTLRTVKNWKIIDFEGEPAKPLAERSLPDIPWRDVAGMVRSFGYAAELSRLDHEQATGDADEQDAELAHKWANRNVEAFLDGYREASGSELDEVLLTAYTADKAVYECVYEARNRPGWLPIPLSAVAQLADQT